MSEETIVAAEPSTAPVMEVDRGPLVNMTSEQRTEFRNTGKLPEPPKKTEEAAPSPEAPKAETSAASEADKPQQEKPKAEPKPKQTAEERIAQLEATIEKIRKGAGKETPKAESSPAKPSPEPQKQADKEPTPEDTNADGTPKYKTYEEFTKAQARWEIRQEIAEQKRQEAEQAQAKAFFSKVDEARARYENFDEVVQPTATAINTDTGISPVIKQLLSESDYLADILFTLGSDPAELASFVKMSRETPGKAIRYVALLESLTADELEAKKQPVKTEDPPVKPKTQAPKPPSEAGGRSAAPPDPVDSAAKMGDFRSYKAERTRRDLARLKG